jgi:hypothetical protein
MIKVPQACFELEMNELVVMCTSDNRNMHAKCTKHIDGVAVIDLLPRVRYLLRITPPLPADYPSLGGILLESGLLVMPDHGLGAAIVMNTSDKVVRLLAGRALYPQPAPV